MKLEVYTHYKDKKESLLSWTSCITGTLKGGKENDVSDLCLSPYLGALV